MSLEEILEYIMPKIVFKAEIFADILVQRQQKETAKRITEEWERSHDKDQNKTKCIMTKKLEPSSRLGEGIESRHEVVA